LVTKEKNRGERGDQRHLERFRKGRKGKGEKRARGLLSVGKGRRGALLRCCGSSQVLQGEGGKKGEKKREGGVIATAAKSDRGGGEGEKKGAPIWPIPMPKKERGEVSTEESGRPSLLAVSLKEKKEREGEKEAQFICQWETKKGSRVIPSGLWAAWEGKRGEKKEGK